MKKHATVRPAFFTPATSNRAFTTPRAALDAIEGPLLSAHTYMNMKFSDAPADLNMFVGPEWSFRKTLMRDNKANFYDQNALHAILDGLKSLSAAVPDMLFMPGSIVWAIPDVKKGFIAYNTVPVLHNGEIIHLYHKSDWGGDTEGAGNFGTAMRYGGESGGWGDILRKKYTIKKGGKKKSVTTNSHFFELGGRTFGVEVCADHNGSMLFKQYAEENKSGKGIDVHVIISCGMFPQHDKIAARKGGFVVHCDGMFESDTVTGGMSNKTHACAVRYVSARLGSVLKGKDSATMVPPGQRDNGELTCQKHKRFLIDDINKRVVVYRGRLVFDRGVS